MPYIIAKPAWFWARFFRITQDGAGENEGLAKFVDNRLLTRAAQKAGRNPLKLLSRDRKRAIVRGI
jgi:hypothetical protein